MAQPAKDADQPAAALARQAFDAIVIELTGADDLVALAAWPVLVRSVLDAPVLVLAQSPARRMRCG